MSLAIHKEDYKGYQIKFINTGAGTFYYSVYSGSDRITMMQLNSVKACQTVIDTLIRVHEGMVDKTNIG